MGYKILGWVVWRAIRHRYGHLVPSRRATAAGTVALLVAAGAFAAVRRGHDE